MLNEQYKQLFTDLGLPVYEEDQEKEELPFEELKEEKPKEEIFAYIQAFARTLLVNGAGPYTIYKFKETCNDFARKGRGWQSYLALCCKYAEQLMRYKPQKAASRIGRDTLESEESKFWVY